MNQAKRAIIMAAGNGSRMRPITYKVPKPLVKVNGVCMIDSIINGLHNNGIYDIYIVVGYLKDKFEVITERYEGITLIENPYYATCNNISSLYVARDYITNSIIIDGDQMIYNDKILNPRFPRSGYCTSWAEKTDEWLLTVDNGIISSCSRTGGKRGFQLYSISFWSKEDGKRLKKDLEYEFEENKNRNIYWDDIAMFCHPSNYELGIREIKKRDLIEIDSLEELVAVDSSYSSYLGEKRGYECGQES